jgi:formylglycine-generating enzyme required for sulfatase activity
VVRRSAVGWGAALALGAACVALVLWPGRSRVECGKGFSRVGARCLPGDGCPAPLERSDNGSCDAKLRVLVPKTKLTVGASDWEAEGQVASRTLEAGPLWIDAFEATRASFAGGQVGDPLRAASAMTRDEAAAYCLRRDGRLPTEDEWIAAAAGLGGHRYPWGETGAVCRRAAFGLARGPCSFEGDGPDTVGAHEEGDSARGVHDLAGNVAEWVAPRPGAEGVGVAKGGSWRSELAAELRVWARLEVDPAARDDRVGVRCAYDAP